MWQHDFNARDLDQTGSTTFMNSVSKITLGFIARSVYRKYIRDK